MLRKFNYKLFRFLKVSGETKIENYRILILSNIYILSFVICVLSILIPIYYQIEGSILVSITNAMVYLLGLWLIYTKNYTASKYLMYFSSITSLTINASISGPGNNSFIYLFPIFSSLFILFDLKEIKNISIIFVYIVLNILFLEVTNYSFLKDGDVMQEYIGIHYYLAIGISLGLQFYILFVLVYTLKTFELKLLRSNQHILKQKENLVKVNHQLDSFVYKASHDLRAPLVSVLGLITLMRKQSNAEELNRYMDLQEVSINKLDNHIIDILSISRNNKVEVKNEKFDMEVLVNESFNNLKHLKIDRTFYLEVTNNGDPFIFSEKNRWSVILDNLFSNSIKYYDLNKKESQIHVEIITTTENQLTFTFWDNGVGIKEDQLAKVFTMYHRAHLESFGSGLGLYLVKEVIGKLKGTITIQSEYGEFTLVTIKVPLELA